jgi:hypothetical protein
MEDGAMERWSLLSTLRVAAGPRNLLPAKSLFNTELGPYSPVPARLLNVTAAALTDLSVPGSIAAPSRPVETRLKFRQL